MTSVLMVLLLVVVVEVMVEVVMVVYDLQLFPLRRRGRGRSAPSPPLFPLRPFPSPSPSHQPTSARLSEADSKEFHNPDTASTNSHPTTADTDPDPAPANNASPENRRLNMLISSTQSSALLSAAHTSRQSAMASDGESLEGHMEALQDELRELESDFDAVLARLR